MTKLERRIMKLPKPIKGYLLIEPLEEEASTQFIIVGQDKLPQWGKVLAVGQSTYHEGGIRVLTAPAKIGDTICHSSVGYETVRIEEKEYRVVPFNRVLLIK